MNVSEFMHKPTVTISEAESIQKVVDLIFNFRIAGIPVVRGKKLVGIVTESDILHKLYPSVSEFIEDYSLSRNFEEIETNMNLLVSKPVKEIMNKKVRTVYRDIPIMKALSLMLVNEFSHLPVIDDDGNLIGIISQGDIFRALVGTELPHDDAQKFRDWLSYHYDLVTTWDTRLQGEIASLTTLFEKENVRKIVDIMTGTGEHPIELAKHNFEVLGLEEGRRMCKMAQRKLKKQSQIVQEKVSFVNGDYIDLLKGHEDEFDAAILMGNGLPYMPDNWKQVLSAVSKSMSPKKATLVLQIRNLEVYFRTYQRLEKFTIAQSGVAKEGEYAFVVFYTPPRNQSKYITATMSILQFDGRRWSQAGINSAPLADVRRKNLRPVLQKLGFKRISFFGSNYGEPLFKKKFQPLQHYWLNVVAQR